MSILPPPVRRDNEGGPNIHHRGETISVDTTLSLHSPRHARQTRAAESGPNAGDAGRVRSVAEEVHSGDRGYGGPPQGGRQSPPRVRRNRWAVYRGQGAGRRLHDSCGGEL